MAWDASVQKMRRHQELVDYFKVPIQMLDRIVIEHAKILKERDCAIFCSYYGILSSVSRESSIARKFGITAARIAQLRDRAKKRILKRIDETRDLPKNILDYDIEKFFTETRMREAGANVSVRRIINCFRSVCQDYRSKERTRVTVREVLTYLEKHRGGYIPNLGDKSFEGIEKMLTIAGLKMPR